MGYIKTSTILFIFAERLLFVEFHAQRLPSYAMFMSGGLPSTQAAAQVQRLQQCSLRKAFVYYGKLVLQLNLRSAFVPALMKRV